MWKCCAEMCLGEHIEDDVVKAVRRFLRKHLFSNDTSPSDFARVWDKIENCVIERKTRKGNYWVDNLQYTDEVVNFYCQAQKQKAVDIVMVYHDGFTDAVALTMK